MAKITDQTLRDKMIKNTGTETTVCANQTKHLREEEQGNYNTSSSNFGKKHTVNDKPMQRMEKFGTRPKSRPTGNRSCRFCSHGTVHHYTNALR